MPKKSHKPQTPKLNPSLRSSSPASSSHAPPERSVNDLIQHLRQTQISGPAARKEWASKATPRSVHPSIRNLLELPETPPPRPRHDRRLHRVGDRRIGRSTPGPAAPASWLAPTQIEGQTRDLSGGLHGVRAPAHLDRLPGIKFPPQDTLQHTVLKSMALKWDWHLIYDGVFLSELPTHLKLLLLSYIAVYTDHEAMGVGMQGLKPLFMADDSAAAMEFSGVIRLDLGRAIGRWIGLKQLSRELKCETPPAAEQEVPTSWEEEAAAQSVSTTTISQPPSLRFQNLQYLSLAEPAPGSANWANLLSLLSNLSTITHLSLAHWPVPTLKPNSFKARLQHPKHRSLTFAYGGTDMYSSYENVWTEAATILTKLSRTTYCLKWLDLQGCSAWIPALCWDGVDISGAVHSTSLPEWNGSWRGIEWLGLEPGWVPELASQVNNDGQLDDGDRRMDDHLRAKQREAHAKCIETAKDVRRRILAIRKEGGEKWLDVSMGPEDLKS